ncbi:MAG TPA: hypothetical protein VGP07_03660 [Polyangia bacterium]
MRNAIGLSALALGFSLVGCGQISYFQVEVTVDGTVGGNTGTLKQINSCEVMTSGAVSDETDFTLSSCSSSASYADHPVIGTFEYGTTKDSGTVTFKILLKDGSLNTLGQGSVDGNISAGKITPLELHVTDTSGF